MRHHADAVGQRFGFFQVMRGEQHRAAFGDELANRRPQLLAYFDIHANGRFVEKQQLGATAQGQRKLHAALLAAGKLGVGPRQQLADAGQLSGFGQRTR